MANENEGVLLHHIRMLRTVQDLCEQGLKNPSKSKTEVEQLRDDLAQISDELDQHRALFAELGQSISELKNLLQKVFS